ncbi:hypothetical protein OZX73_02190 [Bifidobacterium sp. ESL0775]|uniref:hypothetical protein n=1 Tax=Bifidobacterium sp. ESL0775 TaxID=2983230 RepID=UPI0023F6277B|nr:hypothetical protein [Bifidobacterium sp. ESL0775]WEV69712.1 hypothetical protein OZX73_02190 [Bifidobacterium sp. ESL0775]
MVSLRDLVDQNIIKKTGAYKKYTINGQNKAEPIYSISLKYLYYNDQNGRISTALQKYLSTHEGEHIEPCSDIESDGASYEVEGKPATYNDLFASFIVASNRGRLLQTKETIQKNTQQEPGVVLNDGRVIDGNRRFTALRLIQQEENVEQYFEAAILEFDIDNEVDKKTIKQLELDLQMGKEDRVDYDPIDRIFDVYNTVCEQKLMTAQEYAKSIGKKNAKGVNQDIEEAKLISGFLKFINASESSYYLAKEMKLDGPMHEIRRVLDNNGLLEDGEVCSAIYSLLAISYAKVSRGDGNGDVTRDMRSRLNALVNSAAKDDWVTSTEDDVDTIYDAFQDQVIDNTAQISDVLSQDDAVVRDVEEFDKNSRILEKKNSYQGELEQVVSDIADCLDTLQEIDGQVLSSLGEDLSKKAARKLKEIVDVANAEYNIISETGNLL